MNIYLVLQIWHDKIQDDGWLQGKGLEVLNWDQEQNWDGARV